MDNALWRVIPKPREKNMGSQAASALSLFVFRIFADYSDTAFSFNDLAFFANRFY